jgi:hypothetical protein
MKESHQILAPEPSMVSRAEPVAKVWAQISDRIQELSSASDRAPEAGTGSSDTKPVIPVLETGDAQFLRTTKPLEYGYTFTA